MAHRKTQADLGVGALLEMAPSPKIIYSSILVGSMEGEEGGGPESLQRVEERADN